MSPRWWWVGPGSRKSLGLQSLWQQSAFWLEPVRQCAATWESLQHRAGVEWLFTRYSRMQILLSKPNDNLCHFYCFSLGNIYFSFIGQYMIIMWQQINTPSSNGDKTIDVLLRTVYLSIIRDTFGELVSIDAGASHLARVHPQCRENKSLMSVCLLSQSPCVAS